MFAKDRICLSSRTALTIVYNGEDYFADNVFHLNAEQKELANNYAQNLSVFLGDGMFQRLPNG